MSHPMNRLKRIIIENERLSLDNAESVGITDPACDVCSDLLIQSIVHGDEAEICHIVAAGADINYCDGNDITPLINAILLDMTDMVEVLLGLGAYSNRSAKDGITPLMHAAMRGNARVCDMLIKAGASLDAEDVMSRTALQYACIYNQAECVKLMLDRGAHIKRLDEKNNSLLHLCATHNALHVTNLLANHIDLDIRNDLGHTACMTALICGNIDVLYTLIDKGACPNIGDNMGRTLLHMTSALGDLHTSEFLVQRKCDLGSFDMYGRTAIMYSYAHRSIVELLLDNGADPSVSDIEGYTILDLIFIYTRGNRRKRDEYLHLIKRIILVGATARYSSLAYDEIKILICVRMRTLIHSHKHINTKNE